MKLKKSLFLILGSCAISSALTSCLDNEPYPSVYPTMGTVVSTENMSIDSDTYGLLIPKNPSAVSSNDADSVGQRVLVNINFPDEKEGNLTESEAKEVNIFDLYKVLTKNADDTRKSGTEPIENFGNDNIQITSTSISKEHLNIQFNIDGQDETIPHRISLLLTENTKIDDEGLLEVELKHNKNSDFGQTKYWGVVSYTLSSIPEYSKEECKGFKIIYNSGANTKAEWKVLKTSVSNQNSVVGTMKSSEEIGNGHSLLTSELQ